jgi:hypothetical protein
MCPPSLFPEKNEVLFPTEYVGNPAENVFTDAEREAILLRRKCYNNT